MQQLSRFMSESVESDVKTSHTHIHTHIHMHAHTHTHARANTRTRARENVFVFKLFFTWARYRLTDRITRKDSGLYIDGI